MLYSLDTPPKLWDEKEMCSHCGKKLNELHHIHKATGGQRYYCSSEHRTAGELARLQKLVEATRRNP